MESKENIRQTPSNEFYLKFRSINERKIIRNRYHLDGAQVAIIVESSIQFRVFVLV